MSSFVFDNLKSLKANHYVRKADSANNYWFDFTKGPLRRYVDRLGGDFCLVLYGSTLVNEAYVMPFNEVRQFFSEDFLDQRGRWIGTINGNVMRISARGKGKSLNVARYFNAFEGLHSKDDIDQIGVAEPTTPYGEAEDPSQETLERQIRQFNKKYETVSPSKRLIVSDQVARPGLISDHLKALLKHTCQICGQKGFQQSNGMLYSEAHHVLELHKLIPGSYCSDNIVIVCPTCHRKLHYATVTFEVSSPDSFNVTINDAMHNVRRNILTR